MSYFKINFGIFVSLCLALVVVTSPPESKKNKVEKVTIEQTKEGLNPIEFKQEVSPSRVIGGDNTMASQKL